MTEVARHVVTRLLWLAGAVSLRAKILGIALGIIFVLGLGITFHVRFVLLRTMEEQLGFHAVSVGREVASSGADMILVNDVYALHQLLQVTRTNNPNVRYAFVLDPAGNVLAHTFGKGFPGGLTTANEVGSKAHHEARILRTDEGLIWDVAVPIFGGEAGIARVGLSEANVRKSVRDVTRQLLLTTVLVSLLGITAAALLTWVLTRPILHLVEAAQTLEEVHHLAVELRPSVLDDFGLPAALSRYVTDCASRYPLEIDLAINGLDDERLPPEVETALYRIVQESITNVVRHAHATTASILVECHDGAVRAVIEDDGRGFDPHAAPKARASLGLYGIRERAELLGGTLTIESEPGSGASLFVQIPLRRQAVAHG